MPFDINGRDGDPTGSMLFIIVMLLLVFLLAWLTTRFLASRNRGLAKGKYIRVKDSIFVSRDKNIMLLEVGGKYYLVGATAQTIQLLGEIEKFDLSDFVTKDETEDGGNIANALAALISNIKKAKDAPKDLRQAREAYAKEKNARPNAGAVGKAELEIKTLPIKEEVKNLQLVAAPHNEKKQKGKQEKEPQPEENAFKKALHTMENQKTIYEEDDNQEVMVELSAEAEQQAGIKREAAKKTSAKQKQAAKEDEIDKMLRSIEQRTRELKKKGSKDERKS